MPARPTAQRRVGRRSLLLAPVVGLAGVALVVVGVLLVVNGSLDKVTGFDRVSVGASGTARFAHPGRYVAYYEAADVDENTRHVPALTITLRAPSGAVVRVGRPGDARVPKNAVTYQYKGHNGVALREFSISAKGSYEAAVTSTAGPLHGATVAFGPSIEDRMVTGVRFLVPGSVLVVVALLLAAFGGVRRVLARRRADTAPPGPGLPPLG